MSLSTFLLAAALTTESPYARWRRGPSSDPDFFPIGVWLQAPSNARRYKELGINFYLGLWRGPTQEQLDVLAEAEMPVICAQNALGLAHRDNPIIIGWMHDDEPDNAQSLGEGKGWGPPVPPEKILRDYQAWRAADPTRPVVLNLGQGVANDHWRGRGPWGKPEDYPQYVQGCDIVSYDIYPVADEQEAVHGNLWLVAKGVDRLRQWTRDEKIVWNIVEASRIRNLRRKVSPEELRAEVWMSLVHGSRGIVYFVHQFQPHFVEASLLEDETLREAVRRVNAEIRSLARVLNRPSVLDRVECLSSNPEVPIDFIVKEEERAIYLFAVTMRDKATHGTFILRDVVDSGLVEVLGEERSIEMRHRQFTDEFLPYGVHLYRIETHP